MAERLICTKSKQGHSLSEIGELTGITIDEVKGKLAQATGLTPKKISIIFHTGVELEVLRQFLPSRETADTQIDALAADLGTGPYEISQGQRVYAYGSPDYSKTYSRSHPTTTAETKQPLQSTKTLPKPQYTPAFFFCLQYNTNKLHRVNLLTGERSCQEVPNYHFTYGCYWSELPRVSLLITGETLQ
jgi:hypothetical protein